MTQEYIEIRGAREDPLLVAEVSLGHLDRARGTGHFRISLAEGRSVPTGGTRWRRVRAMGRSGPQSGPFGPSSIEPSEFVTFVTFADLRSTEIAF